MELSELGLNLIPAVLNLIIVGVMIKFPPKKINHTYGYRTKRSMRDQAHWDYANARSEYWFKIVTALMFVAGIAVTFLFELTTAQLIVYILWCVLLVAAIPMIENELKKKFGT